VQPLWKPAQPQAEQRQLIPPDSFFLFLLRLFGKTILSELHSGQRSINLVGKNPTSPRPPDSFVLAVIRFHSTQSQNPKEHKTSTHADRPSQFVPSQRMLQPFTSSPNSLVTPVNISCLYLQLFGSKSPIRQGTGLVSATVRVHGGVQANALIHGQSHNRRHAQATASASN